MHVEFFSTMTIGQTFRLRPSSFLGASRIVFCGMIAGTVSSLAQAAGPGTPPELGELSKPMAVVRLPLPPPPPPPPTPPPSTSPGTPSPAPNGDFTPHPADPAGNQSIDANELSAYADAWLRGVHSDANLLSLAAQIWLSGGGYSYDKNATGVQRWSPAKP